MEGALTRWYDTRWGNNFALALIIIGGLLVGTGVFFLGYAHPTERMASQWMQVTMFDPTPWGATFFDKDWGKCPK